MFAPLLILALAATEPGTAGAPPPRYHITAYTRDQLNIYDANGVLQGQAPAASLPRNAAIVDIAHQHLGIDYQGRVIYLRNAEVTTADLPPICAAVGASTRKATAVTAATPGGINAGVSEHAISCVEKPPE